VLVNPQIIDTSETRLAIRESCISFPGLRVVVPRYERINVKAANLNGSEVVFEAKGIESLILQHEIEHLDGITLLDYVKNDDRQRQLDYAANLTRIEQRLAWLKDKPNGLLLEKKMSNENLLLAKHNRQVILYFSENELLGEEVKLSGAMSRIDIYDPINLISTYTQAMMLSLVFCQRPKTVYMLGFGGGRVPLLFHHYFPEVVVKGSEVVREVVDLTESYFGGQQDERLSIDITDGRKHLESMNDAAFDILLIDCYTGSGNHPNSLATVEFYNLCKQRMGESSVLVTNLIEEDQRFPQKLATLRQCFKYVYDFTDKTAHVLFASNSVILTLQAFLITAKSLNDQYQFLFPFYERAKNVKLLSGAETEAINALYDGQVLS
jgi:spermidine synthase